MWDNFVLPCAQKKAWHELSHGSTWQVLQLASSTACLPACPTVKDKWLQVIETEFRKAKSFNDEVNEQVRRGLSAFLPFHGAEWLKPEMEAQMSLTGLKQV